MWASVLCPLVVVSVNMVCVREPGLPASPGPPSQHWTASGLGGGGLVSHTCWAPREAGGRGGTEKVQLVQSIIKKHKKYFCR